MDVVAGFEDLSFTLLLLMNQLVDSFIFILLFFQFQKMAGFVFLLKLQKVIDQPGNCKWLLLVILVRRKASPFLISLNPFEPFKFTNL